MTKKLFQSLEKAVDDNNLFSWLYEHEEELDKDELFRIARELAYATLNPFKKDYETTSVKEMKTLFLDNLADWYDTFGFDDGEAE